MGIAIQEIVDSRRPIAVGEIPASSLPAGVSLNRAGPFRFVHNFERAADALAASINSSPVADALRDIKHTPGWKIEISNHWFAGVATDPDHLERVLTNLIEAGTPNPGDHLLLRTVAADALLDALPDDQESVGVMAVYDKKGLEGIDADHPSLGFQATDGRPLTEHLQGIVVFRVIANPSFQEAA